MLFEKTLSSEFEMQALAHSFSLWIKAPFFMTLEGALGAGKTTWVRTFLRAYGYQGVVRSPTFTLVEQYELPDFQVYHLDLYRLVDPEELLFLGLEEMFQENTVCMIEWPEKGAGWLPAPDLICRIEIQGEQRHVQIESVSEKGDCVVDQLLD